MGWLALLILTWGQCEGQNFGINTEEITPTSFLFPDLNKIINAEFGGQDAFLLSLIMKKSYFLTYFLAMVMAMGMFSCSSSDDGGSSDGSKNSIAGVYNIDSYTLTFYDNSTFAATDNASGKNYSGAYTYNAPDLILSGVVATRAFSLEEGKVYSFSVARSGNNLTLTNKETGEVVTLTYVSAAPASDGQLTPDEEKAYIETTARMLETYFVANEWQVLTDVAKELQDVNADSLEIYAEEFIQRTITGYNKYGYQYNNGLGQIISYISIQNYVDKLILVSQAHGQFKASYGGKWGKVGSDAGLKFTYTDKSGAVWEASATYSGSTGKIRIDEWKEKYGQSIGSVDFDETNASKYEYSKENLLIDVPTQVTAVLTRNGEVKVQTTVNISKFQNATDEHNQLSFMGQAAGTVDVMIQPTGEPFYVHTDFDYVNGNGSTVNTLIKRGATELVKVAANATPSASGARKMDNVTNASAVVTALNRLTVRMTATDGKSVADAYQNADKRDNRYNEEYVKNCAATINNGVSAYITNGPASTINQGTLRVAVKSKSDYNGNRYELYPTLNFAEGSSYAFEDYFTEAYFKTVIDYAKQLGKDLERMIKK